MCNGSIDEGGEGGLYQPFNEWLRDEKGEKKLNR